MKKIINGAVKLTKRLAHPFVRWGDGLIESLFSPATRTKREHQRRAVQIGTMLQNDLARQGYQHVVIRKKKRNKRQRVQFKKPIICTSEVAYFFPYLSKLPYRITTSQITTDECLRSLSDRVQTPVRADYLHGELCYIVRLSGKAFPATFSFNAFKLDQNAPPLAMPLGVNADKEHSWVDLAEMYHTLIVGPTGKGKSTLIHAALCTWIDRNAHDELALWLIDLKKSELAVYEPLKAKRGKPGIVQRLAYSDEDALNLLQDAFDEMKRRQTAFQRVGAADLDDYARITQEYMPRIVIVIDEILQLMTSRTKVGGVAIKQWAENHLVNISAQGRSAGIHALIATQIVNSEVLTTRILGNYENVICFGVKDWRQSQLAIQDSRAEGLPAGRVILKFRNEYTEHQTCLISPQHRRLTISRVAQSGAGQGLTDPNEAKRFLADSMLLIKTVCEQFDGQWSNRKVYGALNGTIPSVRVEEIAKKLQTDGVLIGGRSKRDGRRVAKAFMGREDLLQGMYGLPEKQEVWAKPGRPEPEQPEPAQPEPEDAAPSMLDIFVYMPEMRKRRGARFFTVRKFYTETKESALHMLLEMKRACGDDVIDAIAGELIVVFQERYKVVCECVCAPPLGGSGHIPIEQHFATRLAMRVGEKLHIPFFHAFVSRAHNRGHFPRGKGEMPPMELADKPPGAPILLVDDLTTSGSTIAEAVDTLSKFGMIFPVVWLGGETSTAPVPEHGNGHVNGDINSIDMDDQIIDLIPHNGIYK